MTVKILYLLTRDLGDTGAAFLREHAKEHTVEVIDLATEKDFGRIVDEISSADRIICW